jgi:hypothetical protein
VTGPAGDDGRADDALREALAAYDASATPATQARVRAALVTARLLSALVPVDDDAGMARPTLYGDDGRPAALAFTGLETLWRWRSDARPLPMTAREVFTEAHEAGLAVVLDVAGPVPLVVEGGVLASLAAGYVPVAGAEEVATRTVEGGLSTIAEPDCTTPGLREDLADALAREPLVAEAYLLAPQDGPDTSDVAVGLVLREDVTPTELVALVRRLADRIGPSPAVQRGVDIAVLTDEQRAVALALAPPAYVASSTV